MILKTLQAVSRQELPQHLLLLFLMPQVATDSYTPIKQNKKIKNLPQKQNNENSLQTKPFKTLTLLSGLWMLCECLMGLMERLIVQTAIDKGWEKTWRLRIL